MKFYDFWPKNDGEKSYSILTGQFCHILCVNRKEKLVSANNECLQSHLLLIFGLSPLYNFHMYFYIHNTILKSVVKIFDLLTCRFCNTLNSLFNTCGVSKRNRTRNVSSKPLMIMWVLHNLKIKASVNLFVLGKVGFWYFSWYLHWSVTV